MDFVIQMCFQWEGITEGLKENYDALEKACNEVEGVKFYGLYGPQSERWNWTYMIGAESREKFWESFEKWSELIGDRPKQLTNMIFRWYRKREPE